MCVDSHLLTLQVWRIAFFGRLEERKGIKLFVEAVTKLQKSPVASLDNFEIFIVGPEAVIDMVRYKQKLQAGLACKHVQYWT